MKDDADRPSCGLPRRAGVGGEAESILKLKTIAVVGCSAKPERAGFFVPAFLRERGYAIVPVNPAHEELLGQPCWPSLDAIPFPVETVLVFRKSSEARAVIEAAMRIGAKAVWLQDGVRDPEGEALAREAGLLVVSDDCMMRRLSRRP